MSTNGRTTAVGVVFAVGFVGAFLWQPVINNEPDELPISQPFDLAEITTQSVSYQTADLEPLGQQALDLIEFDWRTTLPGWRIQFVPGDMSSPASGYTWSHEQRIEVFIRPNATPEYLARVVAHELGHAVDLSLNTPEERSQWLLQRGAVGAPWWPVSGAADFETGAGDFAETFAIWLINDIEFKSTMGAQPSSADLALIAALANG